MKSPIEQLFLLQTLEERSENPDQDVEIQQLRQKIPAPILAHYNRLRVRGKKGVALVRNGVCAGCHMRLPSGPYATLVRGEDIMICDTCGRYQHLVPTPVEVKPVEAAVVEKPKLKRSRKKKADADAPTATLVA
jgi:predicted  nucleic acid-binding Zn-ribbon protein